jgi:hypothetical protein
MNALLLGICSELNINNILATEVSKHACRAIKEADLARRIMFAAKEHDMLPKHIDPGLMALHEISPFPYSLEEIRELAGQITDPSFRIQNSPKACIFLTVMVCTVPLIRLIYFPNCTLKMTVACILFRR